MDHSMKKTVWQNYVSYLLPTVIGMVTYSLYCLADVLFVSLGEGSNGLAALNISLPIFTIYSALAILIGVGASITIGVLKGEGNLDGAHKTLTMAISTVTLLGTLFTLLSILFTKELALLLGADTTILKDVIGYLIPVCYGVLFYMLAGSLTVLVRSDGNPKLVMVAGMTGNLINIILDYIFIIPLGWGTFGAGLATAIGFTISMCILWLHFIMKKNTVHFTKSYFDINLFIRMIKNGLGASLLEISTGVTIFLINLALMKVSGATAVAIFSVISNIAFIAKGLFGGMAQASQPIISLNFGLKNFGVMKLANNYAMWVAGSAGLISFILLDLFSRPIISALVSTDPQVIEQGALAIRLYFFAFAFTGFNTVLMYYFQSIECSFYSTIMAFLRGIGLIFILLLILPRFLGEAGIWLVLPVTELIIFAVFFSVKQLYSNKHLNHTLGVSA
ncbi:MATE family efflux transporter [Niameybacter massiliensis]|uniref:MATE family efflux transporter n=1 Tax=Niameybacter massiliensis TaxID=1658108 RepID=UPI0006B52668|nr:MATE family efflux transporter [Niameybacter massiliensis]